MVVIGAFLFGPIFFLCIGEIGHAFAGIIGGVLLWMIFLGWIVWIVYAFAAPGIVRQKWLTKGYLEEKPPEATPSDWRSIRDASQRSKYDSEGLE